MKAINFILLGLLFSCASESVKPQSIRKQLHSKMDEFRQCYLESNSYEGRHAPDKGFVKVNFTIDSEGAVINEKIAESSFKDANMHACMLGELRNIRFKAPPQAEDGGIIVVTQEINFHRRKD